MAQVSTFDRSVVTALSLPPRPAALRCRTELAEAPPPLYADKDLLPAVIAVIKESRELDLPTPLQFVNYR
jgi:hypothetical protein